MDGPKRSPSNGCAISRNLTPELVPVAGCQPLGRETRAHSPQQVRKLAESIEEFGFVFAIIIDALFRVVAGWGLVLAARKLGLDQIPAVRLTDLSEAKLRALRLALNRLTEDSRWNPEMLRLEFTDLQMLEPTIDFRLTGFETGEIDFSLDDRGVGEEDELPPPVDPNTAPVTAVGDLWSLGNHRVLCGDALLPESYKKLMGTGKAAMGFADPPLQRPHCRACLGPRQS